MDSYDALTELNFILRIFSLHNIYRGRELSISKQYLKTTLILFCAGVMVIFNFYYHSTELSFKINPTVQIMDNIGILFGYVQYVTDIYFVQKYFGECYIAYFEAYNEMDMYFEVEFHEKIRRKVKKCTFILLLLWFLTSSADYAAWSLYFDWLSPAVYAITYFTFLIRVLTILELISHSMLIGYRLEMMVGVLKEHFSLAQDMPCRIKVVKKWPQVLIKSKAKIVPVKIREAKGIARLSSYYLLLSQQANFLNDFFGVRILLHCLYTLSEMTSFVNKIVRVVLGSMNIIYYIGWYPAVTTFLRLVACAALLTSMVYRCEQSSRQSSRFISTLDHIIVNKRTSMEDYTSLQQLRALVSTRPIRFHAANFFNLDWTLILSSASVVVTYAVVLIQTATQWGKMPNSVA